jgi:hypothetical protein
LNQFFASRLTRLQACRGHWLWPTRRRVIAGWIVAFAVWGWLDVRTRGTVDPNDRWIHKTDFTVYTEAGAAFFDGRDPYAVTNSRGWSYLYPPLFAIFVAPLHALDPRNQVFVWFVVSVLLGWGCYRELVRIARRILAADAHEGVFGPIPTWLGAAAVTAAMLPALNCLQRGQVGVAKLYLLLVGFRFLVERRAMLGPLAAGGAFALSITLKITPVVPVTIAVCDQWVAAWCAKATGAWTRAASLTAGTAGGLAITLLVLPGAVVGWEANLRHLNTWWHSVAARAESTSSDDFAGDSTSVRNQSLTNAAWHLGNWAHYRLGGGPDDQGPQQLRLGGAGLVMDTPVVDRTLLAVRILAGCLAVAVGARMARTQDRLGEAAAFGLACAATLVVFSIARAHYYVMLLPAVTFVSLWLLANGRRRLAVTLAIVPCVLVIGHYAFISVAGRLGWLGLGTTLWYLAACGALLAPRRAAAQTAVTARDAAPQPVRVEQPLAA